MDWIYLSPHLDDAALSCGGLVWEQQGAESAGSVEIWTICAGDPPAGVVSPYAESLEARWGTGPQAMAVRRAEDLASCRKLGASARHFPIPDAIYRRSPADGLPLYASEEALFAGLSPLENELVTGLQSELDGALKPQVELVCPWGIGGHVDHLLVRAAAQGLNRRLWFFADYPYVVRSQSGGSMGEEAMILGSFSAQPIPAREAKSAVFPVSEQGMLAWVEAVAAHTSQISSFWSGPAEMERDLRAYRQAVGGVQLWSMEPA
jgi:LmbE family N-acetylglucosaminyl deacetylase